MWPTSETADLVVAKQGPNPLGGLTAAKQPRSRGWPGDTDTFACC
jgi:hypothetical protein